MASLDYAQFADNLSREIAVLVTEMPEAFDLADQIVLAGECALEEAST